MGNNIFQNFSQGNNIPKFFLLSICLCVFGAKVCMFAIISILLVLGSCIPKSINYLGGVHVCDCI